MKNYFRFRSESQANICYPCDKDIVFKNEKTKNYLLLLRHKRFYNIDQVPAHLQTNSYILKGYRRDLSWYECVVSFFLFHNETLNVWTHFFGFGLFTFYLIRDFIWSEHNNKLFSTANMDDYLMLLLYLLSVIFCMLSSTMLHLLSGCSAKIYSSCLQLDLLGIAIATLASICIELHLLFKCDLYTKYFYQTSAVLLIATIVFDHVLKPDNTINSTGFIAVALAGFIPVLHWIYVNGYNSNVQYFLLHIMLFYAIFGVGIFFFRTKIPERFAPGCFDYMGASHQLWHIFSTVAFYWWYQHTVEFIKYHQTHACTTVVHM
ncbi:unnamed protein product [Didymodactylos carnosus]|uniref:Uncharacterized protein n=1 Tax=Didymodactylos carnosus TaxID=1234261 RepID=A0A815L332_9BILA|nr:unnamed protein product [Didymodactylos carnosus]CAF1489875.1 unnamed protein product [Didymodactylos carnosus]CAF4279226.1 unnamed protein product [Didymodactylos carnosus]CAF4296551.1 unnamed protein product [Didymodactylos carnosus]